MKMPFRKYTLDDEIAQIKYDLALVIELKKTVETPGWKQMVGIFQKVIGKFTQDIIDKCDNPAKNEVEIRAKKMMVAGLSQILRQVDARLNSEQYIREQFNKKAETKEVLANKQFQI